MAVPHRRGGAANAAGIGLAAIQVGVAKRIVVMDLARNDEPPAPRYFVNPEVLWASDELAPYEEGCLSVPEIFDEVERPARVRVRYLDELDHLNGVLFIDHLSRLKRQRAVDKVRKAARAEELEPSRL